VRPAGAAVPVACRPVSDGPTRDWSQAAHGDPDDVGVDRDLDRRVAGVAVGPRDLSIQGRPRWLNSDGRNPQMAQKR